MTGTEAQDGPGRGFDSAGRHLDVDRVGNHWRLSCNGLVVETRDLPGGVDDLLGKARDNLDLVMRILEWDAARSLDDR